MSKRLVCFHGHKFTLADPPLPGPIVCPLCGSSRHFDCEEQSEVETDVDDPFGGTMEIPPPHDSHGPITQPFSGSHDDYAPTGDFGPGDFDPGDFDPGDAVDGPPTQPQIFPPSETEVDGVKAGTQPDHDATVDWHCGVQQEQPAEEGPGDADVNDHVGDALSDSPEEDGRPSEEDEQSLGPVDNSRDTDATLPPHGLEQSINIPGATIHLTGRQQSIVRPSHPLHKHANFTKPSIPDFEIYEELGRGAMGVVYRAYDVKHGREVALKTLQRIGPVELSRFRYEFLNMAKIVHENLAQVYERLSDGETHCFTMQLLKGVDFLEYVWSGFAAAKHEDDRSLKELESAVPRLTDRRLKRLHAALQQLARGLYKLHQENIIHRDVKPSNVMVTTKQRRLVVLDFGLAAPIVDENNAQGCGIQGTPEYMSPEQAQGRQLTPASDWYSMGVMLYEFLTGHLPVEGSLGRILNDKQKPVEREPRSYDSSIPVELNNLCMELLEPNPNHRPHGADVLRRLNAADQLEAMRGPGRSAKRTFQLVGRESHLTTLREAHEQVAGGDARTILVHGRSGMGKSELVTRFLTQLRGSGKTVVLQGRCYEQESVPFKALDDLIEALNRYLGELTPSEAAALVPPDSEALTRIFPVLGQVVVARQDGGASIANVGQQELRQRAMQALRELLILIGRRQPLVLYVDDLQWGDEDSARLLADLVRPPHPPRVMLIGSHRRENREDSACLRTLYDEYAKGRPQPQLAELAVDALNEEDATRLALELLGRRDDKYQKLARRIAQESNGSPFFVWELAQHVQEDPDRVDLTLDLDEVIWKRVNRLGTEERRLLELIAVAGRPMLVDELFAARNVTFDGPGLLTELRNNSFVRTTETGERESVAEAYHDRIRESVVKHLTQEVVRGHSLRLAETVEQASGIQLESLRGHLAKTPSFEEPGEPYDLDKNRWQRVFDMATFYDAAGRHERAFPCALAAAEQARSQYALEVAEQQYRIALRGAEPEPAAIRFRVAEGLGDVLNLRGNYEQGIEQYRHALSLAEGSEAKGRIEGKLGELFFKQGDMELAIHHLEKALAVLGRQVLPKSKLVLGSLVAWETLIQLLHTYLPRWFVARRPLAEAKRDTVPIRFYNRLFYVYWFARGMWPTLWTQLRGMNLAERYPPTPELGQAYSLHACGMAAVPLFKRAMRYGERAEQISRESGNLWAQGQTAHFHGIASFAASQWEKCIAKCEHAISLLERAGDMWEANMARYHIADSLYHQGRLQEAVAQARQVFATGTEIGDVQATGVITIVWAAASPRNIPVAEIDAELERPRKDPLSSIQVLQAKGFKLLFHDDQPGEAAEWFQKALDKAAESGIKNTYVAWAYSWRATCLRLQLDRVEPNSPADQEWAGRFKAAARLALHVARSFQNDLPHALRENAYLAAREGKESLARRLFDESLQVAEQQNARYQHAKTLLARGQIGERFGWPDAAQQVADGRRMVEQLENFSE